MLSVSSRVSLCLATSVLLALLPGGKAAESHPASGASPVASDIPMLTVDPAVAWGDVQDPDSCCSHPAAPVDEGKSLAVTTWTVGTVSMSPNQVQAALDHGTFQAPAPGAEAYGVTWSAASQDASGALPVSGDASKPFYAVATVTVPSAVGLVLRADDVLDVWVNGRRQPGDLYGSTTFRTPFRLEKGTNTIVLLSSQRGPSLGIALTTSSHEAVFNTLERTAPDFRVGEWRQQWLGVPLLVFGPAPALDVTARVIEDEHFQGWAMRLPALAGGAVTQIPFLLRPKQVPSADGATWTAQVQVDSPSWSYSYRGTVDLKTVADDANFSGTFLSPDDLSVQFYGVRPPAAFEPSKPYALVLSLHGASVDAKGLVGAYSARDWNYIVAPTNRRPFGFDWEEWGHANAIYTLDEAMARFGTDPTRTYLVGHSMGGHGAWNVGAHDAGRFAMIGPSAGWNSFYSYVGMPEPAGAFKPARAHSKTTDFLENLTHRGIYVIHGTADDDVPISEAKTLISAASQYAKDIAYHFEPGAGHWWDGNEAPGVDCVDWLPLFDTLKQHRLDPTELDFKFISSAPWYSPAYSYLTITSATDPYQLGIAESKSSSPTSVALTTLNARSMVIDGSALRRKGVTSITIDGMTRAVPEGSIVIGPQTGKRPKVMGPYLQVFYRPFLFVYPDGDTEYANYAAYLVSDWAMRGNGHAGALPASALTPSIAASFNLIHLGRARADVQIASAMPFTWTDGAVAAGSATYPDASLMTVFDTGDRLGALLVAPKGKVYQLYQVLPFNSRAGLPDYLVWNDDKRLVAGYYTADWGFDTKLGEGW